MPELLAIQGNRAILYQPSDPIWLDQSDPQWQSLLVVKNLWAILKDDKSADERYATSREKDYNPFQWKEKLSQNQVISIETICEEYMNKYGYKLAGNSSFANSTDSYVFT